VKDVVFLARCIFECQKTPTILEYPYALGCFFEHVIFYVGIWVPTYLKVIRNKAQHVYVKSL
ncbi:MAG: hypothetical protein L3J28_15080, partial [Candidatus Polarisedimenticolaceae bacterium]|nr:hypothetical protein [Candidatus Polarisedimenticolaceae bacterium]